MAKRLTIFWLALLLTYAGNNIFTYTSQHLAYVNGYLVDYLLPKIYAYEVIGLAGIVIWAGWNIFWKKSFSSKHIFAKIRKNVLSNWVLYALITAIFLRQFFVPIPISSVWFAGHFALALSISFLAGIITKPNRQTLWWSIALAGVLHSVFGLVQFATQNNVLPYWLWGEPNFERITLLADFSLNGAEVIRAYGGTSHPHVLGALLSVFASSLLWLFQQDSQPTQRKKMAISVVLPTILAGIWATQSGPAFLSLILVGSYFLFPQKYLKIIGWGMFLGAPLGLALLSTALPAFESVWRRVYLNQAGWELFMQNPIWGQGLNTITRSIEQFTTTQETVRFIQPPHHAGILWLAETGLLGVGLLFITVKKIRFNGALLLALLPFASLDHLVITSTILFVGLLLNQLLTHQYRPLE